MGKFNNQKALQVQKVRLPIVAELYLKKYTMREIRKEVMRRLDLKTYSLGTVHNDIKKLLTEWKDSRVKDMDLAIQEKLSMIDKNIKELYEQWEKSKTDYKKRSKKQRIFKGNNKDAKVSQMELGEQEMVAIGDVSIMAEIRKQFEMQCKLVGLFAPEKTEITGKDGKDLNFEPIKIEVIDSRTKVNEDNSDN